MRKKIININSLLSALLIVLFAGVQLHAVAQEAEKVEKAKLIVKMKYQLINNKIAYVLVKTKSKAKKEVLNAPGVALKVYLDKEEKGALIGDVVTDRLGESVLTIPVAFKDAWNAADEHKFIAVTENSKVFNATNTEISVAKAHIYIDTADDKNVRVVVKKVVAGQEIPVKDVEVKIGLKRSGADLPISDEAGANTDSTGTAKGEFKKIGIVGDTLGNLVLVGKTEDNETYGNLRIEKTVPWGTKLVDDNSNYMNRSLYARRTESPIWLMVVAYSILAAVWGVLAYLVVLIVKISKQGKSLGKA